MPNPQVVDFEGVPLGIVDLGSGPVVVGDADTIIERLQAADLSGGSATIDIEIVALSLQSVDPVDLGFGAGFEFITIELNTSSPSVQSTMTIQDSGEGSPHGTFDSTLNFTFDVVGSVGGFYGTQGKTLDALNNSWRHSPTGALLVSGINTLLNGLNSSNDIWPIDVVVHDDGFGTAIHRVFPADFIPPEPPLSGPSLGPLGALLVAALMGLGIAHRRGLRSSYL